LAGNKRGRRALRASRSGGRPEPRAALVQLGVERGQRLAADRRVVGHVAGHRVHRYADHLADAGRAQPDHRDVGQPSGDRAARLAAGLQQPDGRVQDGVPHAVDRLARRQQQLAGAPQHFVRHLRRVPQQ